MADVDHVRELGRQLAAAAELAASPMGAIMAGVREAFAPGGRVPSVAVVDEGARRAFRMKGWRVKEAQRNGRQ